MKTNTIYSALIAVGLSMLTIGCKQTTTETVPLKTQIAQKIMIDLLYYCEQPVQDEFCRTPLTELPDDIAKVISDSNIGGVILFAANIVSNQQTIKLNYDLQQAAKNSSFKSPLLISVDQEGGRVFRTSREHTTAFTGNMSIGATYNKYGLHYARETARVIGAELNALGFNVNHAPTIDVNSNPNNPVINIRSFGENPQIVADLGQAQIENFQAQGIIGTIKHFPGHGDTATDSHTGLPQVNRDLETIWKEDIGPFKQIIDQHAPGMIMTAHIQYPALDNTTFVATDGTTVIKPATMSRKIITNVLRHQLNYNGVVVTDAMDMAGISHFFNQHDAVINTFKAGVDIALMPIKIRTPDDLNKLSDLIEAVVVAVESGELDRTEIKTSFERIQKLKADYKLKQQFDTDLAVQLTNASKILGIPDHKALERELAEKSITLVSGDARQLPIKASERVHLIMPDRGKCLVLETALVDAFDGKLTISCTSAQSYDAKQTQQAISQADVVIGAHIAPRQSAAEMGGMDDLATSSKRSQKISGSGVIYNLLQTAQQNDKKVIFISLRSPYEISKFSQVADITLATYAYNTHKNSETGKLESLSLTALAKVLSGELRTEGTLPVTLK